VKVSSATGLVLTLHPHGPASIEQTIVNLAQDYTFSNNYPLIGKKGYFGERMETQAAAARYIECKISNIASYLLFDDMNQVEMTPNYDETVMEPISLLPKLPMMLLNGAEGIGTGFSSVIPSFNHKDICESMIEYINSGKAKKIKPYVHNLKTKIMHEKGKYLFSMKFEEKNGSIYITELPKGYDATKTYRYLNKYIESDFLKDYIDSTVENDIEIELIFKRGQQPSLEEVENTLNNTSSLVPNYTLINEKGVRIFDQVEEIIEVFTEQRTKIDSLIGLITSNGQVGLILRSSATNELMESKGQFDSIKMPNLKQPTDIFQRPRHAPSQSCAWGQKKAAHEPVQTAHLAYSVASPG